MVGFEDCEGDGTPVHSKRLARIAIDALAETEALYDGVDRAEIAPEPAMLEVELVAEVLDLSRGEVVRALVDGELLVGGYRVVGVTVAPAEKRPEVAG